MYRTIAIATACAFAGLLAGCSSQHEAGAPTAAIFNPAIDNRDVVVCKRVATGTRVRKNLCLTQYDWDKLNRESLEYLARNDDEVRR